MSVRAKKELTGRHVLYMLLAFFGVMLAVNIYFTVAAVKSFRGEDVPRSYRQGLEYNQTLAARAVQNDMDWSVRANQIDDRIVLLFQDNDGQAITQLSVEAKLRHPVDTARDLPVKFSPNAEGRYEATNIPLGGKWLLVGTASNSAQKFKFEYELWE